MPFITPADLQSALGTQAWLGVFDDDSSGTVDTVSEMADVGRVISRAHAEVMSYTPRFWTNLPNDTDPTKVPSLLWACELDFAVVMSYARRPEYAKWSGKEPAELWKQATTRMERIATGLQQVTDNAPQAKPGNTGGTVIDSGPRYFVPDPDGTSNRGDF